MDTITAQQVTQAVVYQIYPRSFKDTNADGIGDLQGIIEKLPYLQQLGVTALWLSPIYPSPMIDFGYDVADYANIDKIFGTLTDFDTLVEQAHKRDLAIIMDYVPNHTSSMHEWFLASRSSIDNDKRDWYIWKDPRPDGSPPNNWLSAFGGSAWQFDEKTKQYYLHTWDKEQPDLNWRNEKVEKAMLAVLSFWLKRGVDGFRVDAVDWLYKDPQFKDEMPSPTVIQGIHSEYDTLIHQYTFALPETIAAMKRIVEVVKAHKGKFLIAEAHLTVPQLIERYTAVGWERYQPFNFSLITLPWVASIHKKHIDEYDAGVGTMYTPTYVLGNHDKPRVASRIGSEQARVAAVLLFTLRGTPFIYNGEEIGMLNGDIPKELVRDPSEINSPGLGLGRDPFRTPMQWENGANAGFTNGEPWLPINDCKEINVVVQVQDKKSLLSLYKMLLAYRKDSPALLFGKYTSWDTQSEKVFAYTRTHGQESLLVVLNYSEDVQQVSLPFSSANLILSTYLDEGEKTINPGHITLRPNEGLLLSLSN